MARYCEGCGQLLPEGPAPLVSALSSLFIKKEKTYKFEDGEYCGNCAKIKVDKKRKRL